MNETIHDSDVNGAKSPDFSLIPTSSTEAIAKNNEGKQALAEANTESTEAVTRIYTETHTLEHWDLVHLTIEQQNAIDLLITGCSDREAAEKVGVTRSTVTRWRLYHPAFRAELNMQRAQVWGVAREKLRALVPEAVDIVADAIRDPTNPDRAKLALDLLRSVKVSDGLSKIDGRTEPKAILMAEAYQQQYSSIGEPTAYQIIRYANQTQARLNGLSDDEYNELVEAENEREAAEERAARKAAREAKKKAHLPTLEQLQQPTPLPAVTIAISDGTDALQDRDRYPIDEDP